MAAPYLADAGTFLIKTLFGLYLVAVMLRLLLAQVRADFYNPISQFLVTVTNPALRPLRRIVPPVGKLDVASLVLLLVLQMLEVTLVVALAGYGVSLPGLLVASLAELLALLLNVYLFAILALAVMSWVAPQGGYHPVGALLRSLTRPLLAPAQRLVPPVAGLDLSPLVVLILLQLTSMVLVTPLRDLGYALMG